MELWTRRRQAQPQPCTFHREASILLLRVTVQLEEILEFLLILLLSLILLPALDFWEVQVFKLERKQTQQ